MDHKTCQLTTFSIDQLHDILTICGNIDSPNWSESSIKRLRWLAHDLRFIISGRISWSTYINLHNSHIFGVNSRIILSELVCMHTAPLDMVETFLSSYQYQFSCDSQELSYISNQFRDVPLCCERVFGQQPIIQSHSCDISNLQNTSGLYQIETIAVIAAVFRANNDGRLLSKKKTLELMKNVERPLLVLLISFCPDFTQNEIDEFKIDIPNYRLQMWKTHQEQTYYCKLSTGIWTIEDVSLFLHQQFVKNLCSTTELDKMIETIQSKTKTLSWTNINQLISRSIYIQQILILCCFVEFNHLTESEQKEFTNIVCSFSWHEKLSETSRNWFFEKMQNQHNLWIELIKFPLIGTFVSHETIVNYATNMQQSISWSLFLTFHKILSTDSQRAVLFCLVDFKIVSTSTILTFFKQQPSQLFRKFARKFYEEKVGPLTLRPSIEEVVKRTGISPLQFTVLDTLPTKSELIWSRQFIDCLRFNRFRMDEFTLLPELWGVIASYLIGFTDHLVISLPLSELTVSTDHYITFGGLQKKGISHFHGLENGEPYLILPKKVHGSCPFTTDELAKSVRCVVNVGDNQFDQEDRFLVGITTNLCLPTTRRKPFATTWRKHAYENEQFNLDDHQTMLRCTDAVFWIDQKGQLKIVDQHNLPVPSGDY